MNQENRPCILNLSYGKDSIACLGAIEKLGWRLDRIVHVEIWATNSIPADLPIMVEYKKKADEIIEERWGIKVEHFRATKTFEQQFYTAYKKGQWKGNIYGWPLMRGSWCNSRLKAEILDRVGKNCIRYVGIASDEPNRFHNLSDTKKSPLVEANWTEEQCFKWCKENDLLSPIYTTSARGGCWFCHKQPLGQLRWLRKNYPEYWSLMLKWDMDSIRVFHPSGHSVHDYDLRFQLEDEHHLVPDDPKFKWSMLDKFKKNKQND